MLKKVLALIYGIIFGIANVIPGVSGGTMMVVFGCYDIVCDALALDFKSIKKNLGFLIPFAIGAAAGIVGFSFAASYMFEQFPVPSYLFFIGLILGSVPFIVRTMTAKEKLKKNYIFPFLFAMAVVVLLGILKSDDNTDALTIKQTMSPDRDNVTVVRLTNNTSQTINGWILEFSEGSADGAGGAELFYNEGTFEKITSLFSGKNEEKEPNAFKGRDGSETIAPNQTVTFTYISKGNTQLELKSQVSYKVDYIVFMKILLGAFAAAVAMIIPGVSGSFVMVVLGIYATVIGAIKDFNLFILIPTGLGVLGGIISGAKLIKWMLERYYMIVYSMILGLVIGSAFTLFPGGVAVDAQTFIGLGAMLVGGAISLTVGMERRSGEDLKKVSENLK